MYLLEIASSSCMRIAESNNNESIVLFRQFAHIFLIANSKQYQGEWDTQ